MYMIGTGSRIPGGHDFLQRKKVSMASLDRGYPDCYNDEYVQKHCADTIARYNRGSLSLEDSKRSTHSPRLPQVGIPITPGKTSSAAKS
jgi:hypothetical protein